MKFETTKTEFVITIPREAKPAPSQSGKTLVHASTHGHILIEHPDMPAGTKLNLTVISPNK
jgi:hypothetical protein